MTGKRRIAIYDLDRTITVWPTYSHFLVRSARRMAPWRLALAPLVPLAMLLYRLGVLDRDALKVWMWALLLGRADPDRLGRAVDDFVAWTLARNVRAGALRQIREDRGRGALLVVATAAHELYARPLAEALGIDAVVATGVAIAGDGRVGPGLRNGNLYGQAKLAAVEAFLAENGIARTDAEVTFYSDSASDHPVFNWCDVSVAVDASRGLVRLAAARGWQATSWGSCAPTVPLRRRQPAAPSPET
jgi:HAD superfamily phosphoserine phosphatase-like hydrolase